jgi:hypothetical protein
MFAVVFGLAAGLWSALAPLVVAETYPQQLPIDPWAARHRPCHRERARSPPRRVPLTAAPGAAIGALIAACLLTAYWILLPWTATAT